MKIAVLGGSFNPPHIGHTALAFAVAALGYGKVVFVPAKINPLKATAAGASDADRLAMARIAASGDLRFAVDSCEMERAAPSYTYDTIVYLEKKHSRSLEGKIALVIGDDLLADFDRWHKADALPRVADIIVARRICGVLGAEPLGEGGVGATGEAWRGAGGRLPPSCPPFPHIELGNALLDVSSSDIRGRIARGLEWEHLAGKGVSEYIKRAKLYGYGILRREAGGAV